MEDITLRYRTNVERNTILDNPPSGLVLKAELKHFDGNYLVFGEISIQPPTTEERIAGLEEMINMLMFM